MIDEWNWKGYSLTDGFRGEIGKPTTYATESWLRPDELYRYFTQNNRCSGVSYITAKSEIPNLINTVKPGDIVACYSNARHDESLIY